MEYKMLIVDDEKEITATLQSVFLLQGYNVMVANNGTEAQKIMEKQPLDLILLDIEMPGISGLEVLSYTKSKHPDTKVLMVTAYGEHEQKARDLRCDGFLKKPFSLSTLEEEISRLLDLKGYEEVKNVSHGIKLNNAPKGAPIVDILLVEPYVEIADVITSFLKNSEKNGGYYTVYPVADQKQAVTTQQLIYTDIAMIDLRTVRKPNELVDLLSRQSKPPKDYIFYFNQAMPQEDDLKVRTVRGHHWDGSPLDEKGLIELAELLKASAKRHNLVKS